MNSTLDTVGVVGIGQMGLGMALRLRDGGRRVVVCDIDPTREALAAAAGAVVVPDPAAVGAAGDVLIVCVVDAAQTEDVLFGTGGAAATLRPGACVLLCPTIGPADVERIASRLAGLSLGCLDAPMSGGPARARDGTMSLMVAGEDALFERHRPLLQHLSSRLFRIGPRCGDGARTKLVNNLLAATILAAACEALALAERIGLDGAATLAVIEQSSGQSWIGGDRLPRLLAGDERVLARMGLLAKDSALALAMADAQGARPALGAQAAALFAAACDDGLADADDSHLIRLIRRAGSAPVA
ncbi:NAD(P)-dependent oxidoreductase [Ideonella sp. A 288]|uniref:NAD(P)-dependent oxidoreductase n=1 Tax=Ideonella sp. A 288 TaxID=1962181 RepID=UPI000B4A6234|nr:NAD(P)-dependent oxidoreductase [Ideonella sp. A 288]